MGKADPFAISKTFAAIDGKWSFQYVKPVFRLYNWSGFVKEFRSFKAMNRYILKNSKGGFNDED